MYNFAYLLIKQRLLANVKLADNATPLPNVEWYLEEDTPAAKGALKVSPTVYIRFYETTLKSLGRGVQEGNVQFDVILMTDCLYDGDKRVYDATNTQDNLTIATNIFTALNGYGDWLSSLPAFASVAGTDSDFKMFNSMDRISFKTEHKMKAIQVTTQKFQFYMKDYSGFDKFTKVVVALSVTDFEI